MNLHTTPSHGAAPSLAEAAEALGGEIVALRRAIHADPELGLETPRTLAKVKEALADLPLEWREGPQTTGAVAVLKGRNTGRRVVLRGDMDALPLAEETGLPFASRIDGRMHACGHDGHTAMLAGAARLLAARAQDFDGEVWFMFQPGEEGFGGGRMMVEDGLLTDENGPPDAGFALHVMPNARHGQIACRAGPLMAASDTLQIVVKGAGGHASLPHGAADPMPVAAEIVTALQSMVTRQFDAGEPVVVTVTRIEAGHADNVIADSCIMRGTLRTLSEETRSRLPQVIERLATNIAAAHGLSAEVTVRSGFPVTANDPRAFSLAQQVATREFGAESFQVLDRPLMTAEDFSYVLKHAPGAMLFLGVAREGDDWSQCCGLHSPRMHMDETALPRGAALLAALGLEVLQKGLST
ncbi:M20 family metallopeptidase [Croceicoccus sp. Ery15]|uniref:M20 metallopeptidase family protein n=1 Tax=Croceicoccus sp. Ery15 TaxID=1703338 RepID=UPI001E3EA605|nr:M20 family metallopeptidase [Croceicoccus sp. Ery15]